MSEKEKEIIKSIGEALPHLSDLDKERLLAFGQGIAFKAKKEDKRSRKKEDA